MRLNIMMRPRTQWQGRNLSQKVDKADTFFKRRRGGPVRSAQSYTCRCSGIQQGVSISREKQSMVWQWKPCLIRCFSVVFRRLYFLLELNFLILSCFCALTGASDFSVGGCFWFCRGRSFLPVNCFTVHFHQGFPFWNLSSLTILATILS